jgi:hypothetical protein
MDNSLGILLIVVDGPIKDIVVLETLTNEEITEDLSEIRVIRLVVKAEGMNVVEVDGELIREAMQRTSVGVVIFFSMIRSYLCFLVASSLKALPREGASAEVEHNISE